MNHDTSLIAAKGAKEQINPKPTVLQICHMAYLNSDMASFGISSFEHLVEFIFSKANIFQQQVYFHPGTWGAAGSCALQDHDSERLLSVTITIS